MALEYKDFSPVLKALDEKGKGQAIIATLGATDRDGDVTHPGAFGEQYVKILQAHDWKGPMLGDARVYESGSHVIADFELNLNMHAGREMYESLKWDVGRHRLQEWSYGFQVLEHEKGVHEGKQVRFLKRVKAFEISPVVVGAGIGTGTLILKEATPEFVPTSSTPATAPVETSAERVQTSSASAGTKPPPPSALKRAVSPHHTETDDRVWNAALQQRYIKESCDTANYYRQFYAIADHGDETKRSTYRFPHHFATPDGAMGPASVRACAEGIAMLHKGFVPLVERQGIYEHLAAHLKDAGLEPPEFRVVDPGETQLDAMVQLATWNLDAIIDRVMGIHDLRAAKGMTLTQARIDQMQTLLHRFEVFCQVVNIKRLDLPYDVAVDELREQEHLNQLSERLRDMKQKVETEQAEAHNAAADEHYRRFQSIQRRILQQD